MVGSVEDQKMWCLFVVILLFAPCTFRPGQAVGASYKDDEKFLSWCSKFYSSSSDSDLARIYPTWKINADFVEERNSLGLSYTLSLNKFAHMSAAQFQHGRSSITSSASLQHESHTVEHGAAANIPKYVNWTEKGVVPPVSNQGQCGDSVAFSVVNSVDSLNAIKTGRLVLASTEEYTDCCIGDPCIGGLYGIFSYTCIVKIGGLASATTYKSPDHKCLNATYPPVIKISGGVQVTPRNETALAYAVAKQPVVAAIDASHMSFQLYQSGIYSDPDCSSSRYDHIVLVVGYGSMDGKDFWICQNSWGVDWGMEGYILIARNQGNMCGIATDATFPCCLA